MLKFKHKNLPKTDWLGFAIVIATAVIAGTIIWLNVSSL